RTPTLRSTLAQPPADLPRAEPEALDHRGDAADQRDQSSRRDGARADVADVAAPDLRRAHLADRERRLRVERRREALAPVGDDRDDHEPGEQRAAHHDRADAWAEDVADAEQCAAHLRAELRLADERDRDG